MSAGGVNNIAQDYILRAKEAQKFLALLGQKEVDRLAYACGQAVYQNAEILSLAAVEETGLGNVADKIVKKKAKAEATWAEIRDRKTVGIIKRDNEKRMIYYADPLGVVAGVAPCTNPVATAMFYAMICLKTRNALIVSPHPKAVQTTHLTMKVIRKALCFTDFPEHCLQVIDEPSLNGKEALALSSAVMEQADLVIATGGPKLVDAAYHSGTPAYGVGAGNTPVYIHESAHLPSALQKIVTGRSFDNGIICASEQHLVVPEAIYSKVVEGLGKVDAWYLSSSDEVNQLRELLFDDQGRMKSEFVGRPASEIARRLGHAQHEKVRVIVAPSGVAEIGRSPFSGEKLCPILSMIKVKGHNEALQVAEALLNYQGRGHSAAIHIDEEQFESDLLAFSSAMPATHIIVNQSSATSSGGSRFNWLTPSTTLGCGAYGHTMPMETINLSVKQLVNYKAVAMPLRASRIPEGIFSLSPVAHFG